MWEQSRFEIMRDRIKKLGVEMERRERVNFRSFREKVH